MKPARALRPGGSHTPEEKSFPCAVGLSGLTTIVQKPRRFLAFYGLTTAFGRVYLLCRSRRLQFDVALTLMHTFLSAFDKAAPYQQMEHWDNFIVKNKDKTTATETVDDNGLEVAF